MAHFPIPVKAGRMGRPPLNVKPTVVRLADDVRRRIVALVGENRMAAFIREAVEAELRRREGRARSTTRRRGRVPDAPKTTRYSRPRAVAESARGLDAIAECDSILPGYQSIARRAAMAMRGMAAENAELRSALRGLCKWGGQCPSSAEEAVAHRQTGYTAFSKAREALRHAR